MRTLTLKEQQILTICRYDYNSFLYKKNVIGIGMAYKIIRGIVTTEICIQVYVTKKQPLNELNGVDLIPQCYKGIKTDVIQTGPFKTVALDYKIRPTLCGFSLGTECSTSAGSITCLVTNGTSRYILSCSHVIAGGGTYPQGTRVLQPAIEDRGVISTDVVANLTRSFPINFITPTLQPPNLIDSAIAELTDINIALPAVALIGFPTGVELPSLGMKIQKAGRTTGYTFGFITAIGVTFILEFVTIGRRALMIDQTLTNIPVKPGDSGALALDFNNKAIGQIIGESEGMATISSIDTVLTLMRVNLVTNCI